MNNKITYIFNENGEEFQKVMEEIFNTLYIKNVIDAIKEGKKSSI